MSIIDASTREAGIAQAVRQLRPDGQGVSVRLEDASFDDTVKWLGRLHSQHGIAVNHFTMERLARAGRINASVMLTAGGE
jgi:type II secretory pathway component PulM